MDEVEEIKQRLEVAEVVGGYVQLKQAGRNLKAPCPFHQEKTASFMVSPEKQIWHCFGCQEGGDIYKFVMKMEGLDFRGALELLARRAGVELKSRGSSQNTQLKERLHLANELAVKYFQTSLIRNPNALDYVIKKRKLARQIIKDFQIGYAPDTWEGFTRIARKQGFSEEELIKAGLAGKRTGIYDMFRGRIMFTICDPQGRPVGFTGRVLDDSLPKYLNTPQTLLYDKSRAIFGLHLAKEAIRTHDEVVLVEGNMDVVASHQAGVKQVVAASGTALTLDQLKSLSRLSKNIKLAFDQDSAGLKATERAIELSQTLGLSLKMIVIQDAKDPDELIQKDVKLWQKAIAEAKYVVDYLFERFETEYDLKSATGKRQYSDRLAYTLQRLADPVEQDHYVKLLAGKIDASEDAIRAKIAKALPETALPTRVQAVEPATQSAPIAKSSHKMVEESLLSITLAFPETRISLEDLMEANFSSPEAREVFKVVNAANKKSATDVISGLPSAQDYAKILTLRGEEQFGSLDPADRGVEAFTLARRLQILSSSRSKQELTKQIKAAEASGDTLLARSLLQQYQTLLKSE
jgi:DNA primase